MSKLRLANHPNPLPTEFSIYPINAEWTLKVERVNHRYRLYDADMETRIIYNLQHLKWLDLTMNSKLVFKAIKGGPCAITKPSTKAIAFSSVIAPEESTLSGGNLNKGQVEQF